MDWADDVLACVEHTDQRQEPRAAVATATTRVMVPFAAPMQAPGAHASTALYGEFAASTRQSSAADAVASAAAAAAQRARLQAVAMASAAQRQDQYKQAAAIHPPAQQHHQAPPTLPAVDLHQALQQAAANRNAGASSALYAYRRGAAAAAPPPPHTQGPTTGSGGLAARIQAAASAAVAAAANAMHIPHHQGPACGGSAPAVAACADARAACPGSGGSSEQMCSQGSAASARTLLECNEQLPRYSACALKEGDDECEQIVDRPQRKAAAAPASAARAHDAARSPKARLLCARVSVYTDISSPAALAVANMLMSSILLPGGLMVW